MPSIFKAVSEVLQEQYKGYNNFIQLLQQQLVNPKLTLEERWGLYQEYNEVLPTETSANGGLETMLNEGFDVHPSFPYYVEKYGTKRYEWLIETLEEEMESKYHQSRHEITQEFIDSVKEEILINGQQGFVYDW